MMSNRHYRKPRENCNGFSAFGAVRPPQNHNGLTTIIEPRGRRPYTVTVSENVHFPSVKKEISCFTEQIMFSLFFSPILKNEN